jgi:hypothetical protein
MPDKFLPFSPISEGPIVAQYELADHGYRTKCPPILIISRITVPLIRNVQFLAFVFLLFLISKPEDQTNPKIENCRSKLFKKQKNPLIHYPLPHPPLSFDKKCEEITSED